MSKMNVKGPPYNFSNSVSMSFTDVPNLNLYFEGSVDFESWDDFLNCKSTECDVQSITADYSIVLDDDRVDGQAFCASDSCNFNNLKHRLVSTDTDNFFFNLGGTKVFNPIALAAAYGLMTRGRPIARGHEINF